MLMVSCGIRGFPIVWTANATTAEDRLGDTLISIRNIVVSSIYGIGKEDCRAIVINIVNWLNSLNCMVIACSSSGCN